MKMDLVRYWKSKTFLGYLFSFIGIFLLTLGVLGIVAVGKFNKNIKDEEHKIARNKLYTIAQDMENQVESMRDAAVEIATLPIFRFDNFQQNKYQEIDMLEALTRYTPVCNICDFFFIKYEKSEMLFTSKGKLLQMDVYLKENFDEEHHAQILEQIKSSCAGENDRLVLYKQDDLILFIYSLERYSILQNGQNAVLCFQIKEEDLQKRIENIAGIMNGKVHIDYKDFFILGNRLGEEELSNEQGNVEKQVSLDGNFTVWYIANESGFSVWKEVFSGGEIAVLALCVLLMLALGVLVAWWNFKPVRRIAEKLGSGTDRDLAADWESIEGMIESLLKGSKRDSEILKSQYQVLREQTTLLIISGKYSKRVQEHMTILNIRVDAPVYGVIRCVLQQKSQQEELGRELYRDVKDLAGEGISMYPCWDSLGDFYVLAAVEEEYQLEETSELLRALFEVKEIPAEIGVVSVHRELAEIGKNPVQSQTSASALGAELINPELQQLGIETQAERSNAKQNQTARQAVAYIEANCTSYDLSLDSIAQKFQITSSYLCRIIKQETGMSYKEYLTGLRMEVAKEMLKDPAVSVLDVCQRTGYNNASHFIKVFQKYTGVTPAKFRDEQ